MKTILTILFIAFAVSVSGQIREPLRHYSFDNVLDDSSGNGATLKMYGNPTFSSSVKAVGSHSALLDESKEYFRIPAVDLGNEFFISFWFQFGATVSSYQNIISSTDYDSSWYVRGRNTNLLEMATSANSVNPFYSFTENEWYHCVAYFSKTGVGRYYINGTKIATTDSIIKTYFDSKDSMYIGVDYYTNAQYEGYIDELRIYAGYAPSESQVDSLYEKSYISGYVEPPAYNPITGRHVRFFANGIEKKDKGRNGTFQYWLAKNPLVVLLDSIGISAGIRSGDYDGVCPSGANRWTDTDCASQDFQYAPIRKIKDADDYVVKVYIDPTYGSGGNGSLATPYDSWSDISVVGDRAYLIKAGTSLSISSPIRLSSTDVLLGSYGTGAKPRIVNTAVNHAVIIEADSCTVRDVIIDNNASLQSAISTETRYSNSNISLQGYGYATDVFNCELRRGCFGLGTAYGNHYVVRFINCVIDSMFTEGMYPVVRDYLEVSYTTIRNINLSYAISPNTSYKGSVNTWATGDGIERYDYGNGWKEQWVHHTTIDRRPYGNKAGIMFHNNTTDHIKDITEFCIFYAPLNNGISGQASQCINTSGKGESHFYNNIFHGVECDYPTVGLYDGYGGDTISGNIFSGLDYAIQGAVNNVIENNTFYDNENALYNSSGSVARLFNNIFWLNTTNLKTITAVSSGNNLYTDPSFVDIINFRLNSSSTAINAGATIPYRIYDIYGTTVPQDFNTDIGAVEYIP